MSIAELLDDLGRAPALPGARCRDQWELFDAASAGRTLPRVEVAQAQARAVALCHDCPALQACTAWVDGLEPWDRPRGVVAGRLPGKAQIMTSGQISTPTTALGAQLRALREAHGWRQRDLAALIATQQNRVADWESGRHLPGLIALQRLAGAFDTSVSEILADIM